jgi:hypothetical protein
MLVWAACGGRVLSTEDEATSDDGQTQGQASSSPGESGATTEDTGDGSGSGTTTADTSGTTSVLECIPDEKDESFGPAVAIEIRNEGTEPIYLNPGWGGSMLEIADAATGAPVTYKLISCAGEPCEEVRVTPQMLCGSCTGGAWEGLLKIEPGRSCTEEWSGADYLYLDIPYGCIDCPDLYADRCHVARPATPATYTVTVTAYAAAHCDFGSCECAPNNTGCCEPEQYGSVDRDTEMTNEAELVYPDQVSVSVSFP